MKKIILLGAPGSGKGTQAVTLAESLAVKRVSVGDILREEVKQNSKLGQEAKSYMEKGLLVPDDLVSRIVREHLDESGFILDGYPRNVQQAQYLDKVLNSHLDACIYLDIDEKTIVNRLSKRRVCKNCGAIYHLENMPSKNPGVCDRCQGELIQRKDDTPDVIKKRWDVFNKENAQILEFYRDQRKLITVDGSGDKEEVLERIQRALS